MYAFIISLFLSIHPLPTDSLRVYYETIPVPAGSDAGYDVTTVHPFNCGKICPDWSSCKIDSTGKRRNKFVEYHFPVTCERSMKSVYTGSGRSSFYYNAERKKSATPIRSELVFRFQNDRLEYIAVRHTVYMTPADTLEFGNGLVTDVDPFSNQIQSFWIYSGGRIVKEYLWLSSPTYNPNYADAQERYWKERYLIEKKMSPQDVISESATELPETQAHLWRSVRYNLTQYKYFYHTNE